MFPLLVPRRKWKVDRLNVCVDDFVTVQDSNALRGKWITGRVRGVPRAGRKSQERKSENTNWRIFKAYHEDSSSATS